MQSGCVGADAPLDTVAYGLWPTRVQGRPPDHAAADGCVFTRIPSHTVRTIKIEEASYEAIC